MIAEAQLLSPELTVDLTNCDREPIHIPSLIQPHGALLAARASDLRIVHVSENSLEILGVEAAAILKLTLTELLGNEAVQSVQAAVGLEQGLPATILSCRLPIRESALFDISAHRIGGLLCIELELATQERRWDLLVPTLNRTMRELGSPKTIDALCEAVPAVIRQLTGYDRVMVYRFDQDGNGEVAGESRDPEMEPFLGLHYPATDIPAQARKLYLAQRLRVIVNVGYQPVQVIGPGLDDKAGPLDMSHCGLRSVSPIHIEYLQNMGVGATLAISLVQREELWGMIVCHHRTEKRLPPETRALCELLGQLISLLITGKLQADEHSLRLQIKVLLDVLGAVVKEATDVGVALEGKSAELLHLVGASGALIRFGAEKRLIGKTPRLTEAESLMTAMHSALIEGMRATDRAADVLPEFSGSAEVASGALMIHTGGPGDGVLWFRGEVAQTVNWAGNPDESKIAAEAGMRLTPRKSFALWKQVVTGRSLPWLPAEREAAGTLRRMITGGLLQQTQTLLTRISLYDPLTGLPNRRAMMEELEKWQRSTTGGPATMLFIDLDNFGTVNEAVGHPGGDDFLKQIGDRLSALANEGQYVARLGGDEFVIFCQETGLQEAGYLAKGILNSFRQPIAVEGVSLNITMSIGVTPVNRGGTAGDPMRAADSAMCAAKQKGGDQVVMAADQEEAKILRLGGAAAVIEGQRAAAELATAYRHVNAVLDSTTDGILEIGRDWKIRYSNRNAARLGDFEPGKDFWGSFPAIGSAEACQPIRTAMDDRLETQYESFAVQGEKWYRGYAFPTEDGISLFFTDITVEKGLEVKLEVEQLLREKRIEALSHMAGGLAHEISNPLAIIHARASDLAILAAEHDHVIATEVASVCGSIIKTSDRAMRILRGLKGFAREAGKDPMERASIYDIVEPCIEMQEGRFKSHNIELRVELRPGIPVLLCRETQIGQIITNLLNNAFDAIDQAKCAERWTALTAWHSEGDVILEVEDSGPGVEDHFKAHLMEAFFTTKNKGLGMGVGLSLSRAIAQDHRGSLTLQENRQHTCFRLSLPAAGPPEEESVTETTMAPELKS